MKDLVRGFMKWLMIVLATLTVILWVFIVLAYCQYEAARPKETQDIHPAHPTDEDFENGVRFIIVEAVSKDHRLFFYKKEYRMRMHLGSFAWDKYTKLYGDWHGCYAVLYCKPHNFAYIAEPCDRKK